MRRVRDYYEDDDDYIKFQSSYWSDEDKAKALALIPGVPNKQLILVQMGQAPISTLENPSNRVGSKPKTWEKGDPPLNTKSWNQALKRRKVSNPNVSEEIISVWNGEDGKQYVYLREINKFCSSDNISLKLGEFVSIDKWQKLINDFSNTIPLRDLECYCEELQSGPSRVWEDNNFPKNARGEIETIERRQNYTNKTTEYLIMYMLNDENYYLYLKIIYVETNSHKLLKMGLWDPSEQWNNLRQDFINNKPVSELENYCKY